MIPSLSVKERVLIYLNDVFSEKLGSPTEEEQTAAGSQEEIANALFIRKDRVVRPLKDLTREGLMEKKRFYVRKTGRFRYFYFLTSNGIFEAKKTEEEIGKQEIKVRDKDKVKDMSISEVINYLKKRGKSAKETPIKINYTNVLRNISPTGFLDLKTILEPKRFADFSERAPEMKYFFGRENELKEINDFMKSKPKILIIKGIAGIGKSTLVKKVLENIEMNMFWYRFYEFSTLKDMLTKLSDFLSEIDRNKLKNYIEGEKTDINEVLIILEKELRGSNTLLVFDDFQKAGKETVEFFGAFKDLKTDMKLIVVGRAIPLFYDRRDTAVKGIVTETTLNGIDRESSKKLLRNRKIDEMHYERLYEATKGHPLLLELITPGAKKEAYQFIREEIIKTLTDKERKALETASVFRCPFYPRAIMGEDIDYDTIDDLVEKSLMQRLGDAYDLHDIIREFIYDRLNEKQKVECHERTAEYYLKEKEDRAVIETMYHLVKAEKQKKAVKIALREGEKLIDSGYLKEVMNILDSFNRRKIQDKDWIEICMLKGDILNISGNIDDADQLYKQSLTLSQKIKNDLKIAECYRKIGQIEEMQSNWDMAIKNFNMGLEISEKTNDFKGMVNGYYSLGIAHWRKGEENKAISYLNKGLKYSKKIDGLLEQARIYTALGNVCNSKGEHSKTVELYSKSLVISEQLGNKQEIVRAYNNIGTAYAAINERDKAIEYYEKQIKLAEEIGDVRGLIYGLSNASSVYIGKKDIDKATQYCEKGLILAERIGDKFMIIANQVNHGRIFSEKEHWENAIKHFEKAVSLAKEVGSLDALSQSYFEFGKMYKRKGNPKNAREQFKNAVKAYEKLGNKKKVEEVRKELKEISG